MKYLFRLVSEYSVHKYTKFHWSRDSSYTQPWFSLLLTDCRSVAKLANFCKFTLWGVIRILDHLPLRSCQLKSKIFSANQDKGYRILYQSILNNTKTLVECIIEFPKSEILQRALDSHSPSSISLRTPCLISARWGYGIYDF